jgi:hypothetical protein
MKKCIGKPVPAWDMAHRLPIDRPVGPKIQDFGSTFRVNSTFMDAVEPSFLEKQWYITGGTLAFVCVGIGPYVYWLTQIRYPDAGGIFGNFFALCVSAVFAHIAFKVLRRFFFGLRYRPVRFHRQKKTLYSIRKRRYFAGPGDGDIVWEAPWTRGSIFCLHSEDTPFGTVFHIRHYAIDDDGNVVRAFSIGREWTGEAQVEMALAQWNYWCTYMNDGPSQLPKPMLFHTEHETLRESFLFSMYSFGLRTPAFFRIVMMPHILIFTALRYLANATSRAPVWPSSIGSICTVASGDPYEEPRPGTPVGWAETVLAQERGEYSNNPSARAEGWLGTDDGKQHAAAWLKDPAGRAGSFVMQRGN